MAEVLLLLLFLLLLALAARLMTQAKDLAKANETVQVLRPLIEAVKGGDQIRGETIQALAQDLASVPQLKRDNETLKVALADTTRRLDAYRQVEARARELNPNDPPAALRSGS
jgi:cell shape-determining protein MreC